MLVILQSKFTLSAFTSFLFLSMLLLLLLSRFSRVRLCATPETAAHQAPPSLGFSRQEHQSGLPFSSPMHESEKWKWSHSVVSDPQQPHGLQPTRLLRPWDFPGKSYWSGVPLPSPFSKYSSHKFILMKNDVGSIYISNLSTIAKIGIYFPRI